MTPTSELAQTWLADPEGLAHDALRELSDAQWSALTLRLVESLPSSGSDDEQVRLLEGLRRLVGLRGPLPDQPALLAMRQRYVVRLAHAEPDDGPITKVVDALTASSPAPPATLAPAEPKVEPKAKTKTQPGRPRFDKDVIEYWREDKRSSPLSARFRGERLTDDEPSYAASPIRRDPLPVEPARTNPPNPPRQPKKKPTSGRSKPRRWLADVEGLDRANSLKVGTDYVVSFTVGTKSEPHVASGLYSQRAHRGRGTLDLTVQVSSTDFDIRSDPVQPLAVPPTGPTPAPARFLVGARHTGECTLTAAVHCDGNFVTLLHFTVVVGNSTPATLTVVGRPPEGLSTLEPRDISLTLERIDAGYKCHIIADGKSAPPAYLTITPEALSIEVDALQNSLLDVVRTLDDNGTEVFQVGLQIPKAQERAALRTMAHAGERLFRELFFGEQSGADSQELGNYLREAANDEDALLTLQVVDNQAPLPWALLYVGDVDDLARLDWHKFLGLRHLIEQVPLAPLSARQPRGIISKPKLSVGLNINLQIAEGLAAEVAAHQERWESMTKQRTRLAVTTRNSQADVVRSLADKKNADQIVYFYCHAKSAGTDGDPGRATITMEPNKRLTLNDLKRNAGRDIKLTGHPIVFINACDSADLSPLFYTGFVPYFMSRGARGVIGTQCKTPALFAIRCAEMFFARLFDGGTVGESMLATRRELLDVYRNPLGLLYAVHCEIDARITPPLLVGET